QLTARTQADAEFLARELASIRLALADVVTSADIDDLVDRVAESVARRLEAVEAFERKKDSEPLANWAGEAPGQT
ncbi:MAG: hypothetical protein QOJ19_2542, partial [Acidimicrobiia bacterium]|nr:hypothetical protein [Acidimicrobiia bacterium]